MMMKNPTKYIITNLFTNTNKMLHQNLKVKQHFKYFLIKNKLKFLKNFEHFH